MTYEIEKEVFSSKEPNRGFTLKAFYLKEPNEQQALVEIYRNGEPYRRFLFPAYKVWNIAAHFDDIVIGEIDGNFSGYDLAGWTGFNVVPIVELADCACADCGSTGHNTGSNTCPGPDVSGSIGGPQSCITC